MDHSSCCKNMPCAFLNSTIAFVLYIVFLFPILFSTSEAQNFRWSKSAPGIWHTLAGKPGAIDLLNAAGSSPKIAALEQLPVAQFPFEKSEILIEVTPHRTFLRIPLERDEQIFGLGLNFNSLQQRGTIKRLHVDHYGNADNGRTHAPVPFFVSSRGYGVLINSARYIDISVGVGVRKASKNPPPARDRNTDRQWSAQPYSDNIEITIPEGGVHLILFAGPTMLNVVQRYILYCGGGFIPPAWGLGFWQRTPTLYSDQDVLKEVAQFEEKGFPLDVIGLEPGWHSKSYPCTFVWDANRFPRPTEFIGVLAGKGINTNLWMNPYISPDSPLYTPIERYSGTHTVWCGIVPDYSMPAARTIFSDHMQKEVLARGVSGFKIDEVDGFDEWLWPDNARFPSGLDGEQMRQVYGLLVQKLTLDWYKANNRRTYGLVRGSNAGASAFPYVIYNDSYSHKAFITALVNSSFCGVLWTPEVRASKSSEEWLRRMQSVCFSPLAMINAWADGTKPWTYPEVFEACKEVALLRMQLLPYLYSAFARYCFEGIPPFRAMQLEQGFPVELDVRDQYMMGDNLLVAPMFAGESVRTVVLPKGKWFDFYSGEFAGDGGTIQVKPGLTKIPLFVRDGGIIPMISAVRQTRDWLNADQIDIRAYGAGNGRFVLYEDDGQSFDYEKGFSTQVEFVREDGASRVRMLQADSKSNVTKYQWKWMTK